MGRRPANRPAKYAELEVGLSRTEERSAYAGVNSCVTDESS